MRHSTFRILRVHIVIALLVSFLIVGFFQLPTQVDAQAPGSVGGLLECSEVVGDSRLIVSHYPDELTAEAGETITLPISISNGLPYEAQTVSVFVAVYSQESAVPIDWFVAVEDQSIDKITSRELLYTWNIPSYLETGNYWLHAYVTMGSGAEALATMLDSDAVYNVQTISVVASSEARPILDQKKILVDEVEATTYQKYTFTTEGPFTISLDKARDAGELTVESTIYAGAYPLKDMVVSQQKFMVGAEAGTVAVTVPGTEDQYVVHLVATNGVGERTQMLIPLTRANANITSATNYPRLNFVGIAADELNGPQLVACVENRQSLYDSTEQVLGTQELQYRFTVLDTTTLGTEQITDGSINLSNETRSAGISVPFKATSKRFTVTAELLSAGAVVDSHELVYDCTDSARCEFLSATTVQQSKTILGIGVDAFISAMRLASLAILLLVIAIFTNNSYPLVRRTWARQRHDDNNHTK